MNKWFEKVDMSTIGGEDDGGRLQTAYLNAADFMR